MVSKNEEWHGGSCRKQIGIVKTVVAACFLAAWYRLDVMEAADDEGGRGGRAHSVSHHGLTDAEFTKCLEQDIDMQVGESV